MAMKMSAARTFASRAAPARFAAAKPAFADISISLNRSRKSVTVDAAKKSVGDLKRADLEGKRVFVRCDLNVPLDKARAPARGRGTRAPSPPPPPAPSTARRGRARGVRGRGGGPADWGR